MKTFIAVLAVAALFGIGAMAYAHGTGGGGHMMGQGYGGHMMEQGYGGHMRGWTGSGNAPTQIDQKFLDETSALRKNLHDKKFEYFEAQRDPETNGETIAKLEKEIYALQDQIHEKAPRTAYRGTGGYGFCN